MYLTIACVAAFLIILAKKQGYVEWVQVHGNDLFAKMFSCDFCLSFWTCLSISVVWFILTGDTRAYLAPVVCAPITRFLL